MAVTKTKNEVQVSHANPLYMAAVYRMKGDLNDVAAKLATALGKLEEFCTKGMTASQARKYLYIFGIEYFDEPSMLTEFSSHEEAVAAV